MINSNTRKAIAYAYPTSLTAKRLGKPGYFIETYIYEAGAAWRCCEVSRGTPAFTEMSDPALYQQLETAPGEYFPRWCLSRYTVELAEGITQHTALKPDLKPVNY